MGRDVQMNVVCGAPNVKVGMKSPLALSGAVLKDGLRIQSVDKHGVVSEGMLCSQAELGISEDHSGIMELESTAKAGSDLKTALSLDDFSLSFDLTPNRADSLVGDWHCPRHCRTLWQSGKTSDSGNEGNRRESRRRR